VLVHFFCKKGSQLKVFWAKPVTIKLSQLHQKRNLNSKMKKLMMVRKM